MRTMYKSIISNMFRGQFYTLIPVEEFKSIEDFKNALWVRGEFDKSIGKYKCFKYFDFDFVVYRRGNCKGYVSLYTDDDINRIFPVDK